jgi:hypothetical protein
MLKWILLNLIPFKSHCDLKINDTRIYSMASSAKTNYRNDLYVLDFLTFNLYQNCFGFKGWYEQKMKYP